MKQQLQSYGWQRFLSLCLAFVMVFSYVPTGAYATDTDPDVTEPTSESASIPEESQENTVPVIRTVNSSPSQGDGGIELGSYTSPLKIYNSSYYTSGAGNLTVNASTSGYTLTGTASVSALIGDQPEAEDPDEHTAPKTLDISVTLNGLVMEKGKTLTILPVYSGNNLTTLTAKEIELAEDQFQPTSLHTLQLEDDARLKLKLAADTYIENLLLGKDSALTIETNGHTLIAQCISGDGDLSVSGSGCIRCPEIQVQTLTVTGAALECHDGKITAAGDMEFTDATISGAALVGYGETADSKTKTMAFSGNTVLNNVAHLGAQNTNAAVRILGMNSLTGSVTAVVCDYTLQYYQASTQLTNGT